MMSTPLKSNQTPIGLCAFGHAYRHSVRCFHICSRLGARVTTCSPRRFPHEAEACQCQRAVLCIRDDQTSKYMTLLSYSFEKANVRRGAISRMYEVMEKKRAGRNAHGRGNATGSVTRDNGGGLRQTSKSSTLENCCQMKVQNILRI